MSYIIFVIQLFLVGAFYFLVEYIKKLPEKVYQKNLETFKSELQKEIVKLEITEGNLHIKKIEKFTEFSSILYDVMNGVKYTLRQGELEERATKSMESFTKDIMFFASETTIKKFVEYRRYSKLVQKGGDNERARYFFILAELILEMRKDLGYSDNVSVDDYLYIMINDWDENKQIFKERAKLAKELV